eukprot:UN07364
MFRRKTRFNTIFSMTIYGSYQQSAQQNQVVLNNDLSLITPTNDQPYLLKLKYIWISGILSHLNPTMNNTDYVPSGLDPLNPDDVVYYQDCYFNQQLKY